MGAEGSKRPGVPPQPQTSDARRILEAQRQEFERKRQQEVFITAQRKQNEVANTAAALRKNQNEIIFASQKKLQEEAAPLAAQKELQEEAFITAQRRLQEEAATLAAQRELQEEAFITAQSRLQEEAATLAAQRELQEEAFITAQIRLQEVAATVAAQRELQEEAFITAQRKLPMEAATSAVQRKIQEEAFNTAQRRLQEEAATLDVQRKLQEEAFFIAQSKPQEEAAIALQNLIQASIAAQRKQQDKPFLSATALQKEAAKRKDQEEDARRKHQEEAAKVTLQEEAPKRILQEEAAKRELQEEVAKGKQQEEEVARGKQHEEEVARGKQQEDAAKRGLQEEAAKIKVQEEAAKRGLQEEVARGKQQEEVAKRGLQEEAAKRTLHEEAAKRTLQEEAAKRGLQEEAATSYFPAPGPAPRRRALPRSRSVGRTCELPKEADDLHYCCTCYTRSKSKMFACENGHGSCNVCKKRRRVCGICSTNITNSRSYEIENNSGKTRVPCPHAALGCVLHIKLADMEIHLEECPFKIQHCPLGLENCGWFGRVRNLWSHFADVHPNHLLPDASSEQLLRNIHSDDRYIWLIKLGYHFIFHLKVCKNDSKVCMAVQLIGTKISASKWLYEVHVYKKSDKHRKYMYTDNCRSSIDDMGDVLNSGECAVLPTWYANTFFSKGLTFKIFIKMTNDNRRSDRNQRGQVIADYSDEEEDDNSWFGSCTSLIDERVRRQKARAWVETRRGRKFQ